jgi:nucleotide-binding universal stress UspA family protein
MMRTLALVDLSLYGKSVIDHASWIAATTHSTLDILHVVSANEIIAKRMPVHPGGAMMLAGELTQDEELEELRLQGGVMLAETRTALMSRGLINVRTRIEEGHLLAVVAEAARSADLVVMGKRGEHADLARLPLGGNVERIIRDCNLPVLVASRTFRPVRKCLFAYDFDDASANAIDAMAIQKLVPPMPVLLLHVGRATDEIRAGMTAATDLLSGAGFEVTPEVVEGDPQRVIPERAVTDNIDLVVMGAFSRARLKSLIFGNLTAEVLRACQMPVLLCRSGSGSSAV